MTKKDIEGKIADLEAEKGEYEGVKSTLEGLLDELGKQKTSLEEGVLNPIAEPYPLAGESGEDWAGANYETAEESRAAIATALDSYDGEIGTLEGEISEAITELEKKIEELQKQIDQLWEEWKTAPDEEPEEVDAD
ncbi:MAG: DUF5082 family protein [Oribacterium sp.]|nr:DUF5082 family protein [Oribacterium sp.]